MTARAHRAAGRVGGAEPTSLARPTGARLHDRVAGNAGVLDRTDAAADLRRQGEDLSGLRLRGEGLVGHLHSLFLPALALTLAIASITTRSLRNAILETMGQDFVRTARAKGVAERRVFTRHVLRNSALSTVTILGVNLAFLIGGTTIIETIFAIPGLGQLVVTAVFQRDYPVIQGVTLTIGVIVLLINLVTELSVRGSRRPRAELRMSVAVERGDATSAIASNLPADRVSWSRGANAIGRTRSS